MPTLAETLAAAKAAATKRLAEIDTQLAKLRAEIAGLVKERKELEKTFSNRNAK